jgi:hypothetical protein
VALEVEVAEGVNPGTSVFVGEGLGVRVAEGDAAPGELVAVGVAVAGESAAVPVTVGVGVNVGVKVAGGGGIAVAVLAGSVRCTSDGRRAGEKKIPAESSRAAGRMCPRIWAIGSPLWALGSCDLRTIGPQWGDVKRVALRQSKTTSTSRLPSTCASSFSRS